MGKAWPKPNHFPFQVDIDLTDPDVGKAAVKIQAGFKNFMARKNKDADEEASSAAAGAAAPGASASSAAQSSANAQQAKQKELEEEIVSSTPLVQCLSSLLTCQPCTFAIVETVTTFFIFPFVEPKNFRQT